MSWADGKEDSGPSTDLVFERSETDVDENGIKYVTEIRYNDEGKKVKVVKKVKVERAEVRENRRVHERRNLTKFGKAKGAHGIEEGVTMISEPVMMEISPEYKQRKNETSKVPLMEKDDPFMAFMANRLDRRINPESETRQDTEKNEDGEESSGGMGLKAYVVPGRRHGGGGAYEPASVRISNLPDDVDDRELRRMFAKCGQITKFVVVRDRQTDRPKGFGFVTYESREEAERAIQRYDGYGFQHVILHVEWAKPPAR